MAKIFSDFDDVRETRENADCAQDGVKGFINRIRDDAGDNETVAATSAICSGLNALRLEIRAAAQHISAAVGAALEQQAQRR